MTVTKPRQGIVKQGRRSNRSSSASKLILCDLRAWRGKWLSSRLCLMALDCKKCCGYLHKAQQRGGGELSEADSVVALLKDVVASAESQSKGGAEPKAQGRGRSRHKGMG